jgi:hypothetical protein
MPPAASITLVREPMSSDTDSEPTATIRSPCTATRVGPAAGGVDGVDVGAGDDEVGVLGQCSTLVAILRNECGHDSTRRPWR